MSQKLITARGFPMSKPIRMSPIPAPKKTNSVPATCSEAYSPAKCPAPWSSCSPTGSCSSSAWEICRSTSAVVFAIGFPPFPLVATLVFWVAWLVLWLVLDHAGPFDETVGNPLGIPKSFLRCDLTRESVAHLVPDRRADALEGRNVDILDSFVWHGRRRGIPRIGVLYGLQREICKWGCFEIVGFVVQPAASPRRHVCPSVLLGSQFQVVFAGCPGDELFRKILAFGAFGDGQCPRPK